MDKQKKRRTVLERDKERLPWFYEYEVSEEVRDPYKMKKKG